MTKYSTFNGQQEGERILLTIHPHKLAVVSQLLKVNLATLLILIVMAILNSVAFTFSEVITTITLLVAVAVFVAGIWTIVAGEPKNVTYVTDRRLVRFQATTPFSVQPRSLSWQDVVKIKTFPPNFIWRALNVGTVIAHSHSTMVNQLETKSQSILSDDDIDIHHVYYYRDIGNYLDKILYLYRQTPKELASLKPFVFKPRGKRD